MNYAEIVSLALSYADRSDDAVASRMDSFLRIVEARVNRKLTVMDMTVRTLLTTLGDTEYYSLPDDFSGLRDIEIRSDLSSSKRTTLQYLSPEQMNCASSSNLSGSSNIFYTIVAGQIQIQPIQDAGKILEIIYYRRIIPLTEGNQTNWVSISSPDLYIFGLLVEISSFVKDAAAKSLWDDRFVETVIAIDEDDGKSRWSGTAMQVRLG